MKTNKTKLKFGVMKPYKRKPVYEGSMQFLRQQIDRPIPPILSEQLSSQSKLEK